MGVYFPQAALTLEILWEDFQLTSDASLQKTYTLPILAKDLTVNINDYTSADTFEADIDYKNFPFDPRLIRACGVTIHMQDVGKIFNENNSLAAIKRIRDNAIFMGFADEESISFDDTKRTVHLEGRDFTSLLIDTKYLDGTIPMDQKLDVLLQKLLSELKQTAHLKLDNRTGDTDLPIIGSFFDDKHQLSGRKNVDREENYWEVIQDLVARAGLIAYIELDQLVLTKPQTLFKPDQAKIFVYGKNVKNLKFKRKIGRRKQFNVIVRSLSPEGKAVVEAKIPKEATAEWSKNTGIANLEVVMPQLDQNGNPLPKDQLKPAPYMSFRLPDVHSKDQLIKYGQEVYEEISRQQIEGSFETKEMETTDFSKKCFNLLQLRNGSPIELTIDQGDLHGISTKVSVEQRINYLVSRGYDQTIARVFAENMDRFVPIFYTKAVKFSLSNEDGFKASIDFINFIDLKTKAPGAP